MDPDQDALWAETTDGGLLQQMFGQYPTIHDAHIHRLEIDRSADQVTMTLQYEDEAQGADRGLLVRVRLIWSGVRRLEFELDGPNISAMTLSAEGDLVRTDFAPGLQSSGVIVSENFEALLDQVQPAGELPSRLSLRLV